MPQRSLLIALLVALLAAPSALAADVNGDGLADLTVLGPQEADGTRHSAVVVLGSRAPANVDTAHPAPGTTFALRSALEVTLAAPVGDVDGDGLDDLGVITTGPKLDRHTWLVFGRRDVADVGLERDAQAVPQVPAMVWPIGDVNGDGVDDWSFANDANGHRLTIIFGRRDRRPITAADIAAPGAGGFRIGAGPWRDEGIDMVASAGDANGDGIDDLVIAPEATTYCGEGGSGCGQHPFVIFGRRGASGGLQLTKNGVVDVKQHDPAGYSVNAVSGYLNLDSNGDVDGDGRDDLFITGWEYGQGAAIAFGTRSTSPVRMKPPFAVRIHHTHIWGYGAGPIGDFNGDGLADTLVTIQPSSGATVGGTLAVVPGSRKRVTIDPRKPAWQIAIPKGAGVNWYGPVGDVNGDGLADFAVKADAFVAGGQPGRTWVVLGTRGALPSGLEALGAGGFVVAW